MVEEYKSLGPTTLKRKQPGSGAAETGTLKKRHKPNPEENLETKKKKKKRNRKRIRTKGFREEIKRQIEISLRSSPSPIAHLFNSRDSNGTPQAPLKEVAKVLHIDESKLSSFRAKNVERISNLTDIFSIEEENEGLMIKYRTVEWNIQDCTVYLDQLPDGCTYERIQRLVNKYGTVVELRVATRHGWMRQLPSGEDLIFDRRLKSFAFVQYTDPDAVKSITKAFEHNGPFETSPKRVKKHVETTIGARFRAKLKRLSRIPRRKRTHSEAVTLFRLRRVRRILMEQERAVQRRMRRRKAKQALSASIENITKNGEDPIPRELKNGITEKEITIAANKMDIQSEENIPLRRRNRNRHRPNDKTFIKGSIHGYFYKIQAIPYNRYVILRDEYKQLRKESNVKMKRILKSMVPDNLMKMKLSTLLSSYRDSRWSL